MSEGGITIRVLAMLKLVGENIRVPQSARRIILLLRSRLLM